MAPLKDGGGWCFIHSPKTRSQRSAARSKGGTANRRPEPTAAPTAKTVSSFELGPLGRKDDIARALVRLAHAIARGEIDSRRGRLAVEALRAASLAAGDNTDLTKSGGRRPVGSRPTTDDELRYCIEHGEFPEGVVGLMESEVWVLGAPWVPPAPPPAPAEVDTET